MKYLPLKNKPNVSESNLQSIAPSLKMDDRGFPCISWLDIGHDINEVRYSFWDGLKWSYYDTSKVYISNENIIFSPNSLVLDRYNSPLIAFSRRINNGFRLSLSNYTSQWNFSNYDVSYEVGWIGVLRFFGGSSDEYSSSSSLSFSWSMSSSSVNSGSSDSSSSSSLLEDVYLVVVYDTLNEEFNIYYITNSVWTLLGNISAVVNDMSSIRIDVCGRRIGISYVYNQASIKYNFFDIYSASWSFVSFQDISYSLLYGEIIDMGMVGTYDEDNSRLIFGWTSYTSDKSYVNSVTCFNNGVVIPSDRVNEIVESQDIAAIVTSDYIVNGYRKTSLCLNASNQPVIIVNGLSSKMFTLVNLGLIGTWNKEIIDIDGISSGIVASYLNTSFSTNTKISMAADSGDIYYFEPSTDSTFPLSSPDMILLNDQFAYRANYSVGALNGTDITETNNNIAGGTLIDTKLPSLIVSNK